jgi:hypothetical protein
MVAPKWKAGLMFILALLMSLNVDAEIYKCKDAEGSLTYSQTPCASVDKTERVMGVESSKESEPADCGYANKFALATARVMKNGAGSDELFNLYGGLDSLSKGSIGVINYVYQFRQNDAVSIERIAALAQSKCEVRALGKVACEDLPILFTDRLGGCDAEADEPTEMPTFVEPEPMAISSIESQQKQAAARRSNEDQAEARALANGKLCKEQYKTQIEKLDEQMRSGYTSGQGDALRERRRNLRDKISKC